ncbi:hypothetical protein PHAVU_007G228100 [Phaseolus vulgaris]
MVIVGANFWSRKLSSNSIYYASCRGSEVSQHKIKAQIQYNYLRFQQSTFNHYYNSIEGRSTNEENKTKYIVKAVTLPSPESESQRFNFKNSVDSVKNFLTFCTTISASLIAVERLSDISPLFFIGLLQALLPHLFMIFYVNGVNQVFDFEIDKINKPYLPLASGKLSFRNGVFIVASSAILSLGFHLMIGSPALISNILLNFILWTGYSVNAPFLRWKQYPVASALITFVFKRPVVFTRSLIVSMVFNALYSIGLALAKDIPDIEGDKQHGIDSFTMRLGQKKVFWICVFLYEMAFGVAFLAGATSSSPVWIKIATSLGSFVLASILWYQTKYVDVTNPASTRSFYKFIWKLLMGAYFLLPLIR